MENYLHLYIGADCLANDLFRSKLVGIYPSEVEEGKIIAIMLPQNQEFYIEETKLILRPLSNMTEEEAQNYLTGRFHDKRIIDVAMEKDGVWYRIFKSKNVFMPFYKMDCGGMQTLFLLSKHFDLFGLHEKGLCLYEEDFNCMRGKSDGL